LLIEYTGQEIDRGIVRFTAPWCVPCKQYKPIFDGVAREFSDVDFYVIDIESYPEIAEENDVRSIPAVFTVKDGEWLKYQQVPSAPELADAARLLA